MGAGLARERGEAPAGSQRPGFSDVGCSESGTRCNGGAFRDRSSHPWPLLVWPSLAKQLPPGTTIAPLTRQRNRHGSEHRLHLSTKWGLWRRISQGAPGSGVPIQDTLRVHPCKLGFGHPWPNTVLDGHTRSRCSLEDSKLPSLEGPAVL